MVTNKRKAQLIIIATFTAGIIVGAAGQYLVVHQSLSKSGNSNQEVLDGMTRSIKLTTDQRAQVEQFLGDSRQQYQDLRNQMRPQYNAIRDATRKRISSILSTEQQSLYEKWTRDLDAKREQEKAVSAASGSSSSGKDSK
jgi:Spy/CpxP family protein refolding chaperone